MAFEIVKTFTVKASPQAVWELLIDPERIAKCLPGAAITGKVDEKTWLGTMTVKVGPVQSSYKGKIVFDKLDAAARSAEIVATGQDTKGRGGADLRMKSSVKELAPGETEITAASTVNITGILAQMGRGMIQDVSDQMFRLFSERVRAQLESASPPAPSAPLTSTPALSPAPAAPPASTSTSTSTPALTPTPTPTPTPAAAPVVGKAVAPTVVAAPAAPAAPEALDLGSIGSRALLRNPVLWICVLAVAGWVVYRLVR